MTNRVLQTSIWLAAFSIVCLAFASAASLAFSHVKKGDQLPDLDLADAHGQQHKFLGAPEDSVRVFAFVKGGHDKSGEVLDHLSGLLDEFSGRAVSWVLIVSDRHGSTWADSVAVKAPNLRLLIDEGDKLYSTLGVVLSPSVGIGTHTRMLHAYLPYRKIHYQSLISAHIHYVLGDIDSDELAQIMNPSGQFHDTRKMGALRKLKLARMLLDRGKLDSAQIQTEDALAEFPDLVEGYELLAEIHDAAGRPDQADATRGQIEDLNRVE